MTEDMERVHGAISGTVLQLANLASHAAELAVQLAASRAQRAEAQDRHTAGDVADRLRTDRELAAAVWARSRSRKWLATAEPDELVAVWASARAWAPHDTRAARAVEALTRRVADLGVDPGPAAAALDAGDTAALARMLEEGPGAAGPGKERADSGSNARSFEQREEAVLEVLRAEWSEPTLERITAGEAFPALAHKLGRLQDDGRDIHALLRSMPQSQLVAPEIRQPAAFAAWLVDQYAAAEPVRTAAQGYAAPAGEAGPPPRATATAARTASAQQADRGRAGDRQR